jgi:hypothetical protein
MSTQELSAMIQETITRLSTFKTQEQAILKQTDAVTNKTYSSVLVEFSNPSHPDALMVFTTYIGGVKHVFPFNEQVSVDAFYTSLAGFLTELSNNVDAGKQELKTKLTELNNAL